MRSELRAPLAKFTTAEKGLELVPISVLLRSTVTLAREAEPARRLFPFSNFVFSIVFLAVMRMLVASTCAFAPTSIFAVLVTEFEIPAPLPTSAATEKLSADASTS